MRWIRYCPVAKRNNTLEVNVQRAFSQVVTMEIELVVLKLIEHLD
jgi:hypothetical protein